MGEGADSFLFSYHGARLADYKKRIFTKYNEKDKEEHRKAT
jgi:hypothetical protein